MSPIEVIVPEAIVELCQPVAGRGILISLYLSEHSAAARKKIDDLDEGVMAEVERHNEEWFSNRLDSEKIRQYFQPSISMQSSLSFVTQPNMLPQIDEEYGNKLVGKKVHLAMNCTGIIIYPRSFSLRWRARKIILATDPADAEDVVPDHEDRLEIESKLRSTVAAIHSKVGAEVAALSRRVAGFTEFLRDLESTTEAVSHASTELAWTRALEDADALVSKWNSGALCVQSV